MCENFLENKICEAAKNQWLDEIFSSNFPEKSSNGFLQNFNNSKGDELLNADILGKIQFPGGENYSIKQENSFSLKLEFLQENHQNEVELQEFVYNQLFDCKEEIGVVESITTRYPEESSEIFLQKKNGEKKKK